MKRTTYRLRLRRQETGDEHVRTIFAEDVPTAMQRAVVRARRALATMAARQYGQFEVLSCEAETHPIR